MNTRYVLPCLLLAAPLAQAQVSLVSFNSTDYVTANQNLSLPTPVNNGTVRTWEYSATIATDPSSNYTGPTFYSALQLDVTSGTHGFGQAQVVNNVAGDRLTLQSNSVIGNMTTFVFFKKEDFANGSGATDTISFNSTSAFSINLNANGGGSALRAAVLNNGTWYLSSTSFTGTGVKTISDLSAQTWGAWDPTGAPLDAAPGTFSVAGTSLTNIQAVGFWAYNVRGSANLMSVITDNISFTGLVAVPEPSSAAALAGLGVLGLAALRRRRRA